MKNAKKIIAGVAGLLLLLFVVGVVAVNPQLFSGRLKLEKPRLDQGIVWHGRVTELISEISVYDDFFKETKLDFLNKDGSLRHFDDFLKDFDSELKKQGISGKEFANLTKSATWADFILELERVKAVKK